MEEDFGREQKPVFAENPRPLKRPVVIDLTDGEGLTREELQQQARQDVVRYGEQEDEQDGAAVDLPSLYQGLWRLDDMPMAPQPPSMKTKLFDFQRQGLHWMLKRDDGSDGECGQVRGGILGDEMGLGKTLQAIGLICTNLPTKLDRKQYRTQTLVLCPLSCLDQWFTELQMHAPTLTCLRYYGKARNKDLAALRSYDVLLTTYGTVQTGVLMRNENKELVPNPHDSLRQITFFRVILDEAHQIRNVTSRTHKACMLLRSERRWCLTGTPMQNSSKDVGALLRFVGLDEAKNSWRTFRDRCKMVDEGSRHDCQRLQSILKPFLLRRTKRTEIMGAPIFQIPPVSMLSNELDLSVAERTLYTAVEKRYIVAFNRLDRDGDALKLHQCVFVYILRLRQLCLHPLLFIYGRLRNFKNDDGEFLLKSRNKLNVEECMVHYRSIMSFLDKGANFDAAEGGGLNPMLQKMIQFVMATDAAADECSICMDEIDYRNGRDASKAVKTKCKHLFHDGCVREWLEQHSTCPMCRADVTDQDLVQVRLIEDNSEATVVMPVSVRSWLASVDPAFVKYNDALCGAGFDLPIFLPGLRLSDLQDIQIPGPDAVRMLEAVELLKRGADKAAPPSRAALSNNAVPPKDKGEAEEDGNGAAPMEEGREIDEEKLFFNQQDEVPPSTKLTVLVHMLEDMVKNELNSKVLVFSQFTSFLDLIEACLVRTDTLGSSFCRLDGTMKLSERSNEIEQFKSDPDKRIFLLSLKVASLGLNLTAADRVILLDPWYNPSIEAQAIDRCVRFGQTKPVKVMRLYVVGSMEDRLREIQSHKQKTTDCVLNEDSSKGVDLRNVTASSVKLLRLLFRTSSATVPAASAVQRPLAIEH